MCIKRKSVSGLIILLLSFVMIFCAGILFPEDSGLDENFFVDMKIKDEINLDKTMLNSDKERYLNSLGVMDEDIQQYDDEMIAQINNANVEDIFAKVEYYTVDDSVENADNAIDDSECVAMSKSEINSLFQEKYYNDYKNKTPFVSTVKAETKNTATFSKVVTMVKQSIAYEGEYLTTVAVKWLKMPINRSLDVLHIEWDNAYLDTNYPITGVHGWKRNYQTATLTSVHPTNGPVWKYSNHSKVETTALKKKNYTKSVAIGDNYFVARNNELIVGMDLHNGKVEYPNGYNQNARYAQLRLATSYENEYCQIKFMLKKMSSTDRTIIIYPSYVHAKTSADIVSFAFDVASAVVGKSNVAGSRLMYKLASGSYRTYSVCGMGSTVPFTFVLSKLPTQYGH